MNENLNHLIDVIRILRCYPLTVTQWEILLVIAANPGDTITHMVDDSKLTCGTPSDIAISVKRLGEGRFDRPGLGLVKKVQDRRDRRYYRLNLTRKGQRLIKTVMNALF